jgi:hypothetical protein
VIIIVIVILFCISSSVAAGFGGYYYYKTEDSTPIAATSSGTTVGPVGPVPNDSNNIQYAKKVFIGRFDAKNFRLALANGEARTRKDDLTEPLQLMIQSAESKSGCIKYGDKVFIARNASPSYRLALTANGYAKEVKDNLGEPTQLVIQSADNNKSGCVQYGDKIHLARYMYQDVRLQLLNEWASGVTNDISKPTQLEIQYTS